MAAVTEFWADTVKRLKRAGKNEEIVAVARQNLPLPGTFSEMAVALRKQIRARRKSKERYNDLLRQLYHAAVWENFFGEINALCLRNQGASCKVVSQFIPRIKCDYNLIGYEHLDILGVNDVKWLVDAWGEPRSHGTARKINQELYAQTTARFKLEKEREERSAGELFGGQQLHLPDSQTNTEKGGEPSDEGAGPPLPPATTSGNQKRLAVFILIAAAFLGLVILLAT
jgi:hypothetical protein